MNLHNIHNIVYLVGRITPSGVNLLGTCFLSNKPGLFVTANHVTNNDSNNLVLVLPQTSIDGYQDTSDLHVRTMPLLIAKVDPIHDICILKSDSNACSTIEFDNTDNISVNNEILIIGYPHSTQGRNVLTCQNATVGAKILIENSHIKTKHIVINVQASHGQSGSPIFRSSDSKLVAMLIGSYAPNTHGGISLGGIDPQTLHQTTHAISAEYITKML